MKKILIAFATLLCASSLFSQIQKGKWLVGGRTNFSSTNQDFPSGEIKQTNFRVGPDLGYFVRDKFALTLNPGLEWQTYQFGTTPKQKYRETELGLGARYYFLEPDARYNIYAEAKYLFGAYKEDDDESVGYGKYGFGANFVCFLNSFVGFEIGAGYSSKKYEDEDERIGRISFGTGFQIHLDPCRHKKNVRPEMVSKL